MENAHQDLIIMVRAQRCYNRIAESLKRRSTPPAEVRQLQLDNAERRKKLARIEAKVENLEAERKEVRNRRDDWSRELEHFKKQKAMVTNEREFTAVITEIDFATRALDEAKKRDEEIEHELGELHDEAEGLRREQPEEEARHRTIVEAWEETRSRLTEEIHELAQAAKAMEENLTPASRSRFRRLLKSKSGAPLAPVVDGSCSVCHFALRPHVQQRVRKAQEIIECEHCHRLLYLPDHPDFQEGDDHS